MISGLEEQIALKEARRRNEAEIKDEQRRLLEESWRLEEEEAARLVADKAKAVARRRQELDYYNHLAVSRKQAEVERERQVSVSCGGGGGARWFAGIAPTTPLSLWHWYCSD